VEQELKLGTEIMQILIKNLADHTDLFCELLPSLPIRWGVHMGEISELGRSIPLVKRAGWTNILHFLCLLLLSISESLASS
jgi:hypothetical protein